ncbi:DUF1648 domain-containing protein [Paracerasibacillus soli]|uniref:DUF1648 domain-containing protein n=1 Tax=Paracerasibacillus soli TaxID=480284 RepID=A0ABU5CME5_9BACI|nr:DUF1648 domain-containing protein [Virgibacillus soli]MDY0407542.1 DUF1648 domain-containing protein [Virgibacillus soli]
MRKQYVLMTSILAIVVSIVFLISSGYSEETASILYPLLIILFIIGSFFIYIPFHQLSKEVKQENKSWFKKQQIVAVDTRFRGEKLTHSNLWFIIGFAISVATIILTLIFYDRLPNQIPMQYNFKGEVTNWTEKTYRSAFLFPIIQIYLTLLFVFVNTVISKAKQQIDVANPNESIRKNMIFRKRWSRFTIVMGISTVLLFTFVQLSLLFSFPSTIISIVTFVFTIGVIGWAILLSITTGQGGSRIRSKNSHQNESVTEETDFTTR